VLVSWITPTSLLPSTASRMKTFPLLGALVAAVSAQTGVFEPADFNVTEALIANGVNVSAIPQLSGLVERTSLSGCSIAVSLLFKVRS
jgi:hypothetical protein